MTTSALTPPVPTLTSGVDPHVRHLLPEGGCRTFRVLPYAVAHDGVLLVAAADADDHVTAAVVSERLARPVRLVAHDPHDLLAAIDAAYPGPCPRPESPLARRTRLRVAQMLLRSGLITNAELQRADQEHLRTGDPLGEVLAAQGAITEDVHIAVLSEAHDLQRVSLDGVEPDPSLALRLPLTTSLRLRAVPVADTEHHVVVAAARPLEPVQQHALERHLARPVRVVLAHRAEIERLTLRLHADDVLHHARTAGMAERPDESAHHLVSAGQRAVAVVVGLSLVAGVVLRPTSTALVLVALVTALCAAVGLHRALAVARGLLEGPQQVGAPEVATIDERVLPLYTVLVPLHDESARLPGLVECLAALDYPRTRLEVLLLCEEDDPATARTLEALALPAHLRVVVVPDSHPVTKAKACNVGLQLARGDLVVVYDAGDRPEPDQLKKVALTFARALRPTCVQATRHHDVSGPGSRRLVPAWARSIRAVQSDLVLPALVEAGSPVLLGASAHHLPVATLRELGGWDPFDVTAEADLGARLARAGHRTVVLDTETSSAAPQRLGAWLTQCARTCKGLLLTGLVQLRHPGRLVAQVGIRSATSLVLSLAGVVALLLHPLLWAGVVWWAVTSPGPVPDALGVVALTVLVLGNAGFGLALLAAGLPRGDHGVARAALLAPLGAALLSLAAWRGLALLVAQPFRWDRDPEDRGVAR